MEVFLHLWDELDDLAHACRHLATAAAVEALAGAVPIMTAAASALWVYLMLPDLRAAAALLAGTASFWGTYRQLLRLMA
jgi:hypothetical protein